MPVGVGVGTEGVIALLKDAGELAGSGVNVLEDQATLRGLFGSSTKSLPKGMVTIRPVESTVGETLG